MRSLVTGGYPRLEYLIHEISRYEKGELGKEALELAYEKATREVIKEQKDAGIGLVSDGCMRWDDPVTFFAQGIGLELGGLERFFDNNFYYRRPVIKGKIRWEKPVVAPYYKKEKNTIPVCPGPVTLAEHSLDEHYKDKGERVFDFARAVNGELKALEKAGADLIQLDEPSICFADEVEPVRGAVEEAVKGVSSKIILSTYFGSVSKIFPAMLDFPVSVIGIDFVSADNKSVIQEHDFTKALAFGCIDARNTKLESREYMKEEIEWALKRVSEDKLYIKPNFGFDLLPHRPVLDKLKVLGEAVMNE